ncbi:MAG TPA: FAD-dependent monooxygenase [Nakamurella sp.]
MFPHTNPRANDHAVWPVVVVGAGPAGLIAAQVLTRNGIRCLVVAKAAPSTHPKATVASLRTMEMVRSWGLADRIKAGGNDVEWRLLIADTLAAAASGRVVDVGYPSIEESAKISPTRPWAVPQDHLEEVLLDDLRRSGVRVEISEVVEDVRPSPGAIRLTVRNTRSGRARTVAGRYVIAADGAYSAVRDAVGIAAPASRVQELSTTAVVHAPIGDVLGRHRFGIYSTESPVAATFLPAGPDDRWLVAFDDPTQDPQRLAELVRAGVGVPDLPVRVGGVRQFSFVAALADRFRSGHVFLVGDAAHRVTPRGGTGMNMAIAGAANLTWKLSWVIRGWAPDALLDSYEAERRPPAAHNIARSLDPSGSRRSSADEVAVDLAGRIPHRWVRTGRDRVSTLDLIGDGLTRLASVDDREVGAGIQGGPPVTERRLDPSTAAAVGADGPVGLLVRPDGIPLDDEMSELLRGRRSAVA